MLVRIVQGAIGRAGSRVRGEDVRERDAGANVWEGCPAGDKGDAVLGTAARQESSPAVVCENGEKVRMMGSYLASVMVARQETEAKMETQRGVICGEVSGLSLAER